MAVLSQWINIGGIGFYQSGIPYNKSLSQFAFSLVEANAINSAFVVELEIIVCFRFPTNSTTT